MSRKVKDLTANKYGRLTPAFYKSVKDDKNVTRIIWFCKCKCGKPGFVEVRSSHLLRGSIQSCGCLREEKSRERMYHLIAVKKGDNSLPEIPV